MGNNTLNPKVCIAGFASIVFLTPFLIQSMGNSLVKLIEDISYFLMVLLSIYIIFKKSIKITVNFAVMTIIFTVLTYAVLGIYYSGIGIVLLQFREFKYLLLLLILIPFKDKINHIYVWHIMKTIAFICIPVSIIQWLIYKSNGDYITGLMGVKQSITLTFFLLIVFFTEFTIRLMDNKKIWGYYFLCLVPTTINESKIILFLLPLLFLASLFISKRLNIKTIISLTIIVMIILFGWAKVYDANGYTQSFSSAFSIEGLREYMFATNWGQVDAGRMVKVLWALDMIKDSPYFGYGLGASYNGATSGLQGYILSGNHTGDKLGGTRQQIVLSLIDMGVFGMTLVFLCIIYYLREIIKYSSLGIERIIAYFSSLLVLIGIPYSQVFYSYQIMFIYLLYTLVCLFNIKKFNMHKKDIEGVR